MERWRGWWVFLFVAAFLCASPALVLLCASPARAGDSARLTFLHVNDIYQIAPQDGQGGFAPLMTLLVAERAKHPRAITTFGGDLFSPSLLSASFKGKQMVALMNAIGMDVAVVGNHEFDFGPDVAAARFSESKFPWLGSNVIVRGGMTPALGLKDTHLVRTGDVTVGFFGILTPKTATLSSPGPDITFVSVAAAATKAVASLRAAGAEIIVALTHLHIKDDLQLAHEVAGIDLILGGHDHIPITYFENDVLIHKAGFDAHYLAVVELEVTRGRDEKGAETISVTPPWRMIPTRGVAAEPAIAAKVAVYEDTLKDDLQALVGKTTVALDGRRAVVRGGESNLGDLVADSMAAAVDAEVALFNGGSLRGDRVLGPGELTRKDVLSILPFPSKVLSLTLTGAQLRAVLENGVSKVADMSGHFLQVSGLAFVYDPHAPKGRRLVSVEVGGKPLDPARDYRVAVNGYMYQGGNGYKMLARGRDEKATGLTMAQALMIYLSRQGTVSPKVSGRIRTR